MKRLLIITEVYDPEEFIINDVVEELSKFFEITLITRSPSYPFGEIFEGFKNSFSIRIEKNVKVIRYPVFVNYNKWKILKILNLLWQPIATFLILIFLKWDKLFVYQTGSIYTYSLLFPIRQKKSNTVIWAQDLWPEAGYEIGFPKFWPLNKILPFITKITLKHFGTVLSQSDSFQKHFKSNYDINSIVVNNFSKKEKVNTYPIRDQNTSMVYAGNIGSVQNLDELIQLFFKLKKKIIPLNSFFIYGNGSKYNELVKKYSEHQDIRFFGRVDLETVQRALKNCRYAIFSLKEGAVNKTIPSRLQFFYNNNVPIIYLGRGEPARFITHYNCGVVIKSVEEDIDFILEKIKDFEFKNFETVDVFNKKIILNNLLEIISGEKEINF